MSHPITEPTSVTLRTAEQLGRADLADQVPDLPLDRLTSEEAARRIWQLVETSLSAEIDLEDRARALSLGKELLSQMVEFDDYSVGTQTGIAIVWLDVLWDEFDRHSEVKNPHEQQLAVNERFAQMIDAIKTAPAMDQEGVTPGDLRGLLCFANEKERLAWIRDAAVIGSLRVAGYDAFPASTRERGLNNSGDIDAHSGYILDGDDRKKVPFWPRRSFNAKKRGPNVARPTWTELVTLVERSEDGGAMIEQAVTAYPDLERGDAVAMATVDALQKVGIYAGLADSEDAKLPRTVGQALARQIGGLTAPDQY